MKPSQRTPLLAWTSSRASLRRTLARYVEGIVPKALINCNTKCGIWKYFTADDGQIDLEIEDYIVIGTLQSFEAMSRYFGRDKLLPVYVEVEDGLRLKRALDREMQQNEPKYAEMCRRFLADQEDFSEEHIKAAGIERRFSNEDIEECLNEIEDYLNENL